MYLKNVERRILLLYVLGIVFLFMQSIDEVFAKHSFRPYPHDLHIKGEQYDLMETQTDSGFSLPLMNEPDLKLMKSPVTGKSFYM